MKNGIIISLIFVSLITNSCSKKVPDSVLHVQAIEILGSHNYRGSLLGVDSGKNDVYLSRLNNTTDNYEISFIDINSGEASKKFDVRRGDAASPTDLGWPSHMQRLNGKYFLVDGSDKIIMLNSKYEHMFANIFPKLRSFLDFFQKDEKVLFLVGRLEFDEKSRVTIVELYQIQGKERPLLTESLGSISIPYLKLTSNTDKELLFGPIWAIVRGFEKDGKIYWTWSSQRKYFVYDLSTKKKECIELSYLKPKRFNKEEIHEIGEYTVGRHKGKLIKRTGRTIRYVPYTGDLFHFGLYDIGANQIGVIGDLDLKNKRFRLDVITIDSGKYKKSIWFPCGYEFLREISARSKGLYSMDINIDKGFYVWRDLEGEDQLETLRITSFQVKNYQANDN